MDNAKSSTPEETPNLSFPTKDLAQLWRIPFSSEIAPEKIERALRERIKELNDEYREFDIVRRLQRSQFVCDREPGAHCPFRVVLV